jgi:hypothetical protein
MGYYVVGIGGTGAKCVEALTHLCAAGMMPDDGNIYTLFVDPDRSNGSLERSQRTLQEYISCKQIAAGKTDLFKTPITIAKPDVWSPFTEDAKPSLEDFFLYNILKEKNPPASHLFDALYTPAERKTTLEMGFRGHPSIGAAVLAKTVKLEEGEPWRTFRENIGNDKNTGAKIFLIGSIFGGTGAAGFPTIARLIRNEFKEKKVELGGALLLPYFSFVPEENNTELRASSEDFLMSAQAALKYYYQGQSLEYKYYDKDEEKHKKSYNTIYLLGDENLSPVEKFSIGSRMQRNEPHFIELYAAMAAIHFFSTENLTNYHMIARNGAGFIKWEDLPDANGGNTINQKLGQLTRFAFAYLSVYHPMLEDIRAKGKGDRAPWFVDFFERENISIVDGKVKDTIGQVKDYCESFLNWLASIHTSAKGQGIELVKWNTFKEGYKLNEFDELILPMTKGNPDALSCLWEFMCEKKVQDPDAVGFGKFIRNLYEGCA